MVARYISEVQTLGSESDLVKKLVTFVSGNMITPTPHSVPRLQRSSQPTAKVKAKQGIRGVVRVVSSEPPKPKRKRAPRKKKAGVTKARRPRKGPAKPKQ